jgi:hypothetical protein
MLLSEPRPAGSLLTLDSEAVHGRRAGKTPRGDYGVTNCASQGRGWDERNYGVPIQVVHHVPSRMEEPAQADETVGVESHVGAIGYDSSESKLPDAEPTAEIRGAGTGDHDCVEVSSLWFLERGRRDNEQNGYDYWSDYIYEVNWHC